MLWLFAISTFPCIFSESILQKGLLSAFTSPKFSLPHVTFRTLNALNVQLTGFKIISKPMNFTSPNESDTY